MKIPIYNMRIKMPENCLVLEVCFYTPRSENVSMSMGLLTNMKGLIRITVFTGSSVIASLSEIVKNNTIQFIGVHEAIKGYHHPKISKG